MSHTEVNGIEVVSSAIILRVCIQTQLEVVQPNKRSHKIYNPLRPVSKWRPFNHGYANIHRILAAILITAKARMGYNSFLKTDDTAEDGRGTLRCDVRRLDYAAFVTPLTWKEIRKGLDD
jgi:hypothetical protein